MAAVVLRVSFGMKFLAARVKEGERENILQEISNNRRQS